MKTEAQVYEKFEKVVAEIERVAATLPSPGAEGEAAKVPEETVQHLCLLVGLLIAYGNVLDCDQQIKEMLALMRIGAMTAKLSGMGL